MKSWSNKLSQFQKLESMHLWMHVAQCLLLQILFLETMIDYNQLLKTLDFQTHSYLDSICSLLFLITKIQGVIDILHKESSKIIVTTTKVRIWVFWEI